MPSRKVHCVANSFLGSAEVAAGLSNLFGEGFCVGAIGFRRHFATLPIHVAPSLCARLRLGVSWAPLKGPLHIISIFVWRKLFTSKLSKFPLCLASPDGHVFMKGCALCGALFLEPFPASWSCCWGACRVGLCWTFKTLKKLFRKFVSRKN